MQPDMLLASDNSFVVAVGVIGALAVSIPYAARWYYCWQSTRAQWEGDPERILELAERIYRLRFLLEPLPRNHQQMRLHLVHDHLALYHFQEALEWCEEGLKHRSDHRTRGGISRRCGHGLRGARRARSRPATYPGMPRAHGGTATGSAACWQLEVQCSLASLVRHGRCCMSTSVLWKPWPGT